MSEEKKEELKDKEDITLELQLGDVIQITNPLNEVLNEQIFIIDYIDKSKAYLINADTLDRIKLKISENGILGDGNITKIELLSRSDTPSYARQNGLTPGKWVNIYFGGDYPVIIVGEITNLEEDMIEIKTSDDDVIYINFEYKGIPENLPIENIEIREKPTKPLVEPEEEEEINIPEEKEEEEILMPEELEREKKVIEAEKIELVVPVKDIKDQLREFIVKADQIIFGDEELGPVVQYVDVSTRSQRYSIESQVSDLLDDLLSTVPNSQRTPKVLNNIHIIIERFKQLREYFSFYDQYGNVDGALVKQANYRPLTSWLKKFNLNLYWILPVVKNIKKVYNVDNIDDENNDLINIELNKNLKDMTDIINNYRSNSAPIESNKYTSLYSDLASYFIPFNLIDDENNGNIITEKEVNDNINVVIDNLEDMYSSVFGNNMIRNRRFVISKYNIGETKLDITDSTSSKMTTVRIPITKNDIMSIKSIMTLPEPTLRFSKVNLPGTDILSRANLNENFLNYWQLLRKKTNYTNIFVDSFENGIELDENNFVSGIRNYVLNIPEEELKGIPRTKVYSDFISSFIPPIRFIFNIINKYIKGKLSIIDVVSYLEPFLIYPDDLTYKQYVDIVDFIDSKISEYNKNMIEYSRIFKILSSIGREKRVGTKIYSILDIINSKFDDIFSDGYDIDKNEILTNQNKYSNSELLRKITIKDYSKLYTTTLAVQNIDLMFPDDISKLIEIESQSNKKNITNQEKTDKCENIVFAKMYTSREQLENDNDHTIYFDKRYDKTNYGVMEEIEDKGGYSKAVINLTPEQLKEHITKDRMKKYNLSETEASYDAETLINGLKKVVDGNYAILFTGYSKQTKDEFEYYVRKNNKWVLDKNFSSKGNNTNESSIFCDLENKCINVTKNNGDKCESMEINELSLQNSLLNEIINEFDTKYHMSKEDFKKEMEKKWNYFMSIMPIVAKIETNSMLKYNNQKYNIGMNVNDESKETIVSPFTNLLSIILGQKDFVKKQNDIIRFANKFTRPSLGVMTVSGVVENNHWLYCIKTGVPLMPSFKLELAASFIQSQQMYQYTLEKIKSKIGELSDDGDWWTDKYSGWAICPGDFDTEEGFDEGFKVSTRAIMEEDAGNKIMAPESEKKIKYITAETIMINNIINALSIAMGINIEPQKEFIINCVIETIKTTVESESDYKEKVKIAAQKGKKLPSYKDFYNTSLLYYTLGLFLIAIQTSIPSVKTRKTHPGCVRSFKGYPFDGVGDLSSLNYLACVAFDIRDSGEPWNVLKKLNVEKIQTRIKVGIDDLLLQLPDVKRKFEEKTEYLLTNPSTEIPAEHDIAKWSDFLPPLTPFNIKFLSNISEEFKRSLISDLKNGSEKQREKILVIESKIIQFSLAIQEKIQHIVKTNKPLLHTSNNEPYLENSCCDSKDNESTVNYFISRNNDIHEYNQIVNKLTNILDDIRSNTESVMLFSNINTKNVYPQVSNSFDEKTIYMAFIFYCKFKSLMPIPVDLMPVCTNKPDSTLINPSDTIDRIIIKLKEDGRNYTNEQFLRLMQLVSRENIVHIDIDNPVISSVAKLSQLLEVIYDENNENEMLDQSLRDLILNAVNTFDIATEETTKEVKDLNNFLINNNEDMTKEIIDFVQKNSGSNVTRSSIRKFVETITSLSSWDLDNSNRNEDIKISNDIMYTITNFYKTFIKNIVSIFPNIILNKVNYDDTLIPNYYGFSKNHSNKLKKNIAEYFEKLKGFYGVISISKVLETIQQNGKNIVKIANYTPCFSSIKNGDKVIRGIIDERTSRYLFEFYFLRVLLSYVYLSDDSEMIVTEVKQKYEITDLISVEFFEESETKIDISTSTQKKSDYIVLVGNKKDLKQKIAELLVVFMETFNSEKNLVDVTYESIQDRVFKLKEKEKDMVTDRLKTMTDEMRDVDTVMKITKQGNYSKGMQKGLTSYDKDFYEEEQALREEMEKAERKIRQKNKDANDDNIDILVEEYIEQQAIDREIDDDAYDIGYLNEAFYDGNYDGIGAPEEEYDDYTDFN